MTSVMRVAAAGWALGLLGTAAPAGAGLHDRSMTARQGASGRKTAPDGFDRIVKEAAQAREAGRLSEAVGHYRAALGLRPGWLDGHWALATILYDLDQYEEARGHFQRLVAARPLDGVVLALKALCDVRLRDYDVALAGLQRARELGVANAEVRSVGAFQLALLLNRAGSPDAAFEMLRGLAVQGKDSPAVIEALGLSTLRLRLMPDEIPPEKKEMVRLAGRGGYHLARRRRTAVGRLALEELVSRYPTEPNVHYAFGTYIAPEDPAAAIEEFRMELARDPDHFPALVQIASAELRRGNVASALPPAESAARIAPNVPATRLVLGRVLLEAGETGRAVQELEKGATLAPESAEVQFSLSRAYQRAGRKEDAERARQEFLRLNRAANEKDPEPNSGGDKREVPPGSS